MLKFFLVINKQGQPRVVRYYQYTNDKDDRLTLQQEITRKILTHNPKQCAFLEYKDFRIVFRKYLNLYFIMGIDNEENELAVYELLHCIVETLDTYFNKVTEVDIIYNIDRVHMILDEMILNGQIVETSKTRVLAPIQLLDSAKK